MHESSKSLKLKARLVANQNNITIQEVMQSYMFERILVRISGSRYYDNFILKGGYSYRRYQAYILGLQWIWIQC
jgi:hypothetical protein